MKKIIVIFHFYEALSKLKVFHEHKKNCENFKIVGCGTIKGE